MIGYKWVFIATLGATAIVVGCGGDDEGGTTGSGASGGTGTGTQTGTGGTGGTATGTGTGTQTGTGGTGGTGGSGGSTGGGGSGPMADWSCLGTVDAPTYMNGPSLSGTYNITDLLAGTPIADATVNVCAATETDCANPADTGTTDANGMVTLSAPQNEAYYFELDATGYPTHLTYVNGPPMDNWSYSSTPLDDTGLGQLTALLGTSADPNRGHIGLNAFDCGGVAAAGVSFTLDTADGDTVIGYFAPNGFPNSSLTETSQDGRVGIANVPPGAFVLTATVAATNEVIATRSGYVRAGAITFPAAMTPTPEATNN